MSGGTRMQSQTWVAAATATALAIIGAAAPAQTHMLQPPQAAEEPQPAEEEKKGARPATEDSGVDSAPEDAAADPAPEPAPENAAAPPRSKETRTSPGPESATPANGDKASGAVSAKATSGERALPAAALEQAVKRVQRLQAEGGAYAPELDTAYIELGLALREAGEREQAAEAFEQALYVARANHGLYSLEQLAALRHLIEENRTLGNWEEVVDSYFLLYWVHKRQYGTDDPRLLPVIERVANAQIDVPMSVTVGPETAERYHEIRNLLQDAVAISETRYGENDPRVAGTLSRLAWTNFALAVQTGKMIHYREYQAARRGGTVFIDETLAEAFTAIEQSWRRGGDALDRIEEIYESAYEQGEPWAPYGMALARIHLGDWDILYGSGSGRSDYREAYELLGETDQPDVYRKRLMGEPRLLPAPTIASEDDLERPEGAEEERTIELAFDVTRSGRPRDLVIVRLPEGMEDEANTLREYISFQRFRPRIIGGRAEPRRITRRYLVTDSGRIRPVDRMADIVDPEILPALDETDTERTTGTS